MIRLFNHYISRSAILFIAVDLLLVLLAVRFAMEIHYVGLKSGALNSLIVGATVAIAVVLIMSGMGLYQSNSLAGGRLTSRFIAASAVAFLSAVVIGSVIPKVDMESGTLAMSVLAGLFAVGLIRLTYPGWRTLVVRKRRVLVLGTGSRVMQFLRCDDPGSNIEIVGFVPTTETDHYVPKAKLLPMAGSDSLYSLVKRHGVNEIVIAIRQRRGGTLPLQELMRCRLEGIPVIEMSTFFEREDRRVMLESLTPSWILLSDGFRVGRSRMVIKRFFDIAMSTTLLVLTVPLIVFTAVCIALESGFPILYRQERVGEGGKVFTIFKFRSMRVDAERDGTPRWAANDDSRVTFVGRIIRKLRIDELPQIINIFKGDMSFVGPRPERPFFVDKLVNQIPYFSLRHSAKPGITGWAQINYAYGASLDDAVEKLQYDLYYLKNQSLFLDLMIIMSTVEVVLWGKGAR